MAFKKNGNGNSSSAGAKVTVACKVELGVILHVDDLQERTVETQSGSRVIKEYRRGSERVHILGPAYPRGQPPEGFPEKAPTVGGFALTYGVEKDFWDNWWMDNADPRCKPEDMEHVNGCRCTMIVRNRLIFAYEAAADTKAAAVEAKDVRSGLEPLRADGDYRSPRPLAGISQIKPTTASLPNG
jgi:hypothetical protein